MIFQSKWKLSISFSFKSFCFHFQISTQWHKDNIKYLFTNIFSFLLNFLFSSKTDQKNTLKFFQIEIVCFLLKSFLHLFHWHRWVFIFQTVWVFLFNCHYRFFVLHNLTNIQIVSYHKHCRFFNRKRFFQSVMKFSSCSFHVVIEFSLINDSLSSRIFFVAILFA